MTDDALPRLGRITDALFAAEQAGLRDILRREADLRRALSDLDRHRRANLALPAADLAAPRALGADLLWQGWVGRTRAQLNTELSQVLAAKAGRMEGLRRAFGRNAAMTQLIADERRARKQARAARQDAAREAQMVMYPAARYR